MNSIVLPLKVHAVKLEYRRLKIANMPHGQFVTKHGKKYVYVTYDPEDCKISSRHPRRLLAASKMGKPYADVIAEYLELNREYMSLLNEWNSRYGFTPPKVAFPIRQFYDPHKMNNDFFDRQTERLGKYVPDNPTVSDHGELKSKNELMVADLLKSMGIPFKYETEVIFKDSKETINPDYLISFYEIDRCSYVEVLGMGDKLDYSFRTTNKIYGFSQETYRPGREVIYIFFYDKQNFDGDYVVSQILSAFNDMIPDDALIWNEDADAV